MGAATPMPAAQASIYLNVMFRTFKEPLCLCKSAEASVPSQLAHLAQQTGTHIARHSRMGESGRLAFKFTQITHPFTSDGE